MEDELQQAKLSNDEAYMRERIAAVKAICELVLEAQHGKIASPPMATPQPLAKASQQEKIKLDEAAGSDSLFDF